jgi:hypothetical protein
MTRSSSNGLSSVAGEGTPHHHGSHEGLLALPEPVTSVPKPMDAIVIPTARPPAYLAGAVKLAQELGCTLVTLHSGRWTSATQAARCIPSGVDLIAIDVPQPSRLRLPEWETSRKLTDKVFDRGADTSAKRNLALILGHKLGWSRILFLDDDMTGMRANDVEEAGGLLDDYNAVGLRNVGFPDNSVVCHAYRDVGGWQETFVGGGALTVRINDDISFFPDIYNEDWFFLLDGDKGLKPTAIVGQVVQKRYDPYRNPDRARAEELGDVLAEGLYWLLDQRRSIIDADKRHWDMFLNRRSQFIEHTLRLVEKSLVEAEEKRRMTDALKGSLGRLQRITSGLCAEYLQAWMTDQRKWRQHLGQLPTGQTTTEALASLSREGLPQLNWQLGGQSPVREFRESLPIPTTSASKDRGRFTGWSPRPTAPAHLTGIANVALAVDRSEESLI